MCPKIRNLRRSTVATTSKISEKQTRPKSPLGRVGLNQICFRLLMTCWMFHMFMPGCSVVSFSDLCNSSHTAAADRRQETEKKSNRKGLRNLCPQSTVVVRRVL